VVVVVAGAIVMLTAGDVLARIVAVSLIRGGDRVAAGVGKGCRQGCGSIDDSFRPQGNSIRGEGNRAGGIGAKDRCTQRNRGAGVAVANEVCNAVVVLRGAGLAGGGLVWSSNETT
jgi:hypothetical protein